MEMDLDLDAPIPLRERKCPGVLPSQAPTLQQLRRMYTVMRGNHEKPPCGRRGLIALDCAQMVVGTTFRAAMASVCRAWICYPGSMRLG